MRGINFSGAGEYYSSMKQVAEFAFARSQIKYL